jgi:chromosomal replication initiation ATPase DnaA
VQQAISGNIKNPFDEVVHQSILGTQSFVESIKKKLPGKGQREIPSLNKLQHDISTGQVIEEVARTAQIKAEDLLDCKTGFKELRQMAMELSYRYSNAKQAEIGAVFGVDYSTVSQSRARLKVKLKSNRNLNRRFEQINERKVKISNLKI